MVKSVASKCSRNHCSFYHSELWRAIGSQGSRDSYLRGWLTGWRLGWYIIFRVVCPNNGWFPIPIILNQRQVLTSKRCGILDKRNFQNFFMSGNLKLKLRVLYTRDGDTMDIFSSFLFCRLWIYFIAEGTKNHFRDKQYKRNLHVIIRWQHNLTAET